VEEITLFELSDRLADLRLEQTQQGIRYSFQTKSGEQVFVTPKEFTDLLYRHQMAQGKRTWIHVLFNISSWTGVIWICIGFLGQVFFSGRMIVQWIASENAKKSVVPKLFWWMSLYGSVMLLSYFIWRKDIIGVIGQLTGFLIYSRNLWFIYLSRGALPVSSRKGEEIKG
jgi:lipid-A-disaccharide synthase-like uncharacterized protein